MPYNIIFVYLIFMSRVLYLLHSTSVLSFYIDVVLTPSITQDCGHWIHMNVCRVSCGGVSNMLLVLSITFYFHFNIWVSMCSTGLFQYMWLKGYIYSSCYYHHQIGSNHLSHCYHIFPWVCAWDVCYVLDNWQLAELPQSGGPEFDPRLVHDNLSVPWWVYMRFPVPEHQN